MFQFNTIDDISKYVYLKYTKKAYDPLDKKLEYVQKLINKTIDKVIENLFHMERYNLGAINDLKSYKYRTYVKCPTQESEALDQFIQKYSIDLNEIYQICYDLLAIPLILERKQEKKTV